MVHLKHNTGLFAFGGTLMVLLLLLTAVPVMAAPAADDTATVIPPVQTANGSVASEPVWRDGGFVYWSSGESDMSAAAGTLRFVTPEVIGPSGITVDNLMPGFAWAPVLGATKYRFSLYADVGLSQMVTSVDTEISAVTIPEPLTAGQDYYWTVSVIQPAASQSSWATFHTSPQATVPTVAVTSPEASRPRAGNTGADVVASPLALAEVVELEPPLQITVSTLNTAADSSAAILPVIIVVGVLLLVLVLTLLLRPYVID